MYRYYQTSEKSKWKVIKDDSEVERRVLDSGGRKMTILAVSEEISDDTDPSTVRYKGPFYADIDIKGDIRAAAQSAKDLADKLVAKDVLPELIQVYASGSKGFHLIVHEKVFSSGRPQKNLPAVYKEMALSMYVTGLDLQVYCGGRGNSWRIENLEREDGNYRVRVTLDELGSIIQTPELYKQYTSNPRVMPRVPEPEAIAGGMEAAYISAKQQAGKRVTQKSVVTSDILVKEFSEDLPQCVVDMREGKIRSNTNFNQVALNMAVFAARSGRDHLDFSSLAQRMAQNTNSSTYNTDRKREEHCEGVYKYVATSSKYQFSCAGMRSCVSTKPCEECPLHVETDETAAEEGVGIAVQEGKYYRVGANGGATLLATFTVIPKHKVMGPHDDDPRIEVLKGVSCDILLQDGEVVERVFTESAWKTKSNFLSTIQGIESAVFFGSDTDVQRLKYTVFAEDRTIDAVREVSQAGLRIHELNGFPLPVYVEPGMSLNKFGTQGTHTLNRDIPLPPHMRSILLGEEQISQCETSLDLLFQINKPEVIGIALGWFCATFLKSHLMHEFMQFPLLNLWGNAGSGKTRTAEMLMWLTGAASDYKPMSMSLPHVTRFPLINYVTTTTTQPRILEEYNKARLRVNDYNYIHEILKAAYNQHSVSRGAIGGSQSDSVVNAKSIEMQITSPLLYVSEQPVESPPLRQRSVAVGMDSVGRRMGREAWDTLQASHYHRLEVVGKLLCLEAVKTTTAEVREMMEEQVLDLPDMEERPRYNLQVCMLGLEFLRRVLISQGIAENISQGLDKLVEGVRGEFDNIVADTMHQTSRTEVDLVMDDLALMAYLDNTDTINQGLKRGTHYYVDGSRLFLDMPVCHGLYLMHKRKDIVIESYSQFMKLARTESYFVAEAAPLPELGIRRKMVEYDMTKMLEKGIEVSLFEE